MTSLKVFWLALALLLLVSLPSYSDVVLTDEEAAQIMTALKNYESLSNNLLIQTNLWLSQLSSQEMMLRELLTKQEQQDTYYKELLKEAKHKELRTCLIVGGVSLGAGLIIGVVIGIMNRR